MSCFQSGYRSAHGFTNQHWTYCSVCKIRLAFVTVIPHSCVHGYIMSPAWACCTNTFTKNCTVEQNGFLPIMPGWVKYSPMLVLQPLKSPPESLQCWKIRRHFKCCSEMNMARPKKLKAENSYPSTFSFYFKRKENWFRNLLSPSKPCAAHGRCWGWKLLTSLEVNQHKLKLSSLLILTQRVLLCLIFHGKGEEMHDDRFHFPE